MKHKHSARDFLAGAVSMVLAAALIVPAGAALTGKTIEVFSGVEIFVDGVKMEPKDVNGNPVDTFVYEGTTYVPLRAVSQSLGKTVNWDGENQRVYIGEAPGTKQYLLNVCPPYQTSAYKVHDTVTMASQKYGHAFQLGSSSAGGYALFNLNGQYSTLSFDMGHSDGQDMRGVTLNIYLDGELTFSVDMDPEQLPQHFTVPLYNALQMKLETTAGRYRLANVEIY